MSIYIYIYIDRETETEMLQIMKLNVFFLVEMFQVSWLITEVNKNEKDF